MESNERGYVWRYMDFTKFVDLVLTEELHFSQIASLRDPHENGDPFEGKFPEKWIEQSMIGGDLLDVEDTKATIKRIDTMVNSYLVNCWHENNSESAAVWRLYLKSNEGIAIRTTKGKLRESLHQADYGIHVFDVVYVDYQAKIPFDFHNVIDWVLHKRKSFEHEKEVRAVNLTIEYPDPKTFGRVKINLKVLVEEVVVAPTAPKWFHDLVVKLLRDKKIDIPVRQSALADLP